MYKLYSIQSQDSTGVWRESGYGNGGESYIIYDGLGHMAVQITPKGYSDFKWLNEEQALNEKILKAKIDSMSLTELKAAVTEFSSNYVPYHSKVQDILTDLKSRFGSVLLWDCHSIRQVVPTISKEKFPDLILGDADGTSASPGIIETILSTLDHSRYHVKHNHPFKGGQITRHFGKPTEQQHAIQLEMTKVNYMKDDELRYDEGRAGEMRTLLKRVFEKVINAL